MDLKAQIKRLPKSPGVYIFKGVGGEVLYIGKAASLKDRVRSYFSSSSEKVRMLLEESKKIDFIKTDSVLEALVKEANLIKTHWPKFNVREKDDRSFVYIIIPSFKIDPFPSPLIIRKKEIQKYPLKDIKIFGPYQSWSVVKKFLYLIRRIFPYCDKPNQGKPCFYYQLGLCAGACIGKIKKEDYQKIIKNLILFLEGKKNKCLESLKKFNPEKLELFKQIEDSSLLTFQDLEKDSLTPLKIEGYDISHFSGKAVYGSMVVFKNKLPLKEDYRIFKIKEAKPKDDIGAIKEVIRRRFNHKEWVFPDLILIDGGPAQVNAVKQILDELKISIPIIGIAKGKAGDRLIIKGVNKKLRELISLSKPLFQQIRDEAHRFALKFSRKRLIKDKFAN